MHHKDVRGTEPATNAEKTLVLCHVCEQFVKLNGPDADGQFSLVAHDDPKTRFTRSKQSCKGGCAAWPKHGEAAVVKCSKCGDSATVRFAVPELIYTMHGNPICPQSEKPCALSGDENEAGTT